MTLLTAYKIDPFTLEKNLSMHDFQFYVLTLANKVEAEQKEREKNNQGNRLMKSLIAIRDILNYMTYKE